jgi:hypothetical protein
LEDFIFSEQQLENNTNLKLLCPSIDFDVPDNICNIIKTEYKGWLRKIKNKESKQKNLWYCFSPSKKWEKYKSNEKRKGNENCDNVLEQIIQNLFNTKFNIDSIMQTQYYKGLSKCYSNKY